MISREDLTRALHVLCPMYVLVDNTGHIESTGPTLQKLIPDTPLAGQRFLELFHVERPREIMKMSDLRDRPQTPLRLEFRNPPHTRLRGVYVPLPDDGSGLVNLSFGISVLDAVRDHALNATDFAATDLAIELLYLVEAKSAAMDASLKLNHRLQRSMIAAEEKAYTDTLTGLRNRRTVDFQLNRLMAAEQPFSVMHLDLDFFKQVNDTHGHAAGDHVLKVVAGIMKDTARGEDTVARVGGDEFILIFEGLLDYIRLGVIAKKLIKGIGRPIKFGNITCEVSASIGICHFLGTDDRLMEPAELLHRADIALYAAKYAGRGLFLFYDPEMDMDNSVHAR